METHVSERLGDPGVLEAQLGGYLLWWSLAEHPEGLSGPHTFYGLQVPEPHKGVTSLSHLISGNKEQETESIIYVRSVS